jgi:hypothetical protein
MALQSSGIITLSDIQDELGGVNPISLSEYYRGGAYTTTNNTSVPTSGSISLSNFYGTTGLFSFTISSNTQEANLSTLATAAGWDGSAAMSVTIGSGVYVWSDDTANPGLLINVANCTVTNNGYIIGKGGKAGDGGNGTGGDGGPAINVSASGITILNNSGAYIAGGGGAGGGSLGGGGAGGGDSNETGILGGALGQEGDDASAGANTGGGAGGGGGAVGNTGTSNGGAGGRILPGVGGIGKTSSSNIGGNGGSGGSAGSNANTGAYRYDIYWLGASGGGGGWGASGGAAWYATTSSSGDFTTFPGGAGGAAISGTSPTLTNNGTIYGSTV